MLKKYEVETMIKNALLEMDGVFSDKPNADGTYDLYFADISEDEENNIVLTFDTYVENEKVETDIYKIKVEYGATSGINKLKEMINNSNRIVFFGGAGVSTESGIPDFRSKNGLYNKLEDNNPEYLLSHSCFIEKPHLFYEYFKKHFDFRSYNPNITHYKLAELEKTDKLMGVITQNVDGLHSKAGSRNVCELHGNAETAYCCKCKRKYNIQDILTNEKCKCGGYIRPDIVLYGEYLKDENWNKAICLISKADLLIVAGTSLTVYPAKNLLSYAHCPIVIINKDKVDFEADLIIHDFCGNIFKELIR